MLSTIREKWKKYIERNEAAYAAARLKVSEEELQYNASIPDLPHEIASEVEQPPVGDLYVLELQNDDVTPANYVVAAIQKFSKKNRPEAIDLMVKIHTTGKAQLLAGGREALEKVAKHIEHDAHSRRYPLRCIVRAVNEAS